MRTAMFNMAMLMCSRVSHGTIPLASFIQFEKDMLAKEQGNKSGEPQCAGLGRKCVPNYSKFMSHYLHQQPGGIDLNREKQPVGYYTPDVCCSNVCLNGICEDPDYTLFKCTWTQKGVDWICRDGTLSTLGVPIPVANMAGWQCPRIWDPVSDIDWTITMMVAGADTFTTFMESGFFDKEGGSAGDIAQIANAAGPAALGFTDLESRALGGYNKFGWLIEQTGIKLPFIDYFQCGAYTLTCSWTQKGVEKWPDICDEGNREGYWDIPLPQDGERGPCDAGPTAAGEKATYMQLGVKDDTWYKMAEYGLLICDTPNDKFVARTQVNVKAQAVQCGGLPFNCKTKRAAEDACKAWSADPAKAGKYSGKSDLCYKYELGETVGKSCRPMWTKDSNGVEGCYESNNNWWEFREIMRNASLMKEIGPIKMDRPLMKKYDDTTSCEGNLGDLVCMYANDKDWDNKDGLDEDGYGRKNAEPNYGFDAACCVGHQPNPYRDVNGPWAEWKKKHGQFLEGDTEGLVKSLGYKKDFNEVFDLPE